MKALIYQGLVSVLIKNTENFK